MHGDLYVAGDDERTCWRTRHSSARRTASLRTGVTIGAPQDVIKAATATGCGRDLQHLRQHGELRKLLRHAPSLAVGEAGELPGSALARRCTLRIRDPSTGEQCQPGEIGQIEVQGLSHARLCGRQRATQRRGLRAGRLLQDRRSRLAAPRWRLRLCRAPLRDDQALRHQRLACRGGGGPAAASARRACGRDGCSRSGRRERSSSPIVVPKPGAAPARGCAPRPLPREAVELQGSGSGVGCARACR